MFSFDIGYIHKDIETVEINYRVEWESLESLKWIALYLSWSTSVQVINLVTLILY